MTEGEQIARWAILDRKGRRAKRRARLTVWWPDGPLKGGWHPRAYVSWAALYYEYAIGVPATVEYCL